MDRNPFWDENTFMERRLGHPFLDGNPLLDKNTFMEFSHGLHSVGTFRKPKTEVPFDVINGPQLEQEVATHKRRNLKG